ncbi:CsbD family protein [Leisingera methylohalidivorans]|uniref:CsbD family protein n=1 Tax=Leisingera methylohalidivorans TaxID=133924 RepID=UPI00040E83DA|nr:CsbD family protein [Leisingera methylohalidivorans]
MDGTQGRPRAGFRDLTDDGLEKVKGERENLEGLLHRKLRKTTDEARQTVDRKLESI